MVVLREWRSKRSSLLPTSILVIGAYVLIATWYDSLSFTVSHKPKHSGNHSQTDDEKEKEKAKVNWITKKVRLEVEAEKDNEMLEHVDLAVANMLLGSIVFIMSLFYLVNHKDHEIEMYSWKIISSTITIFSAVLLFQGVDGVVETVVDGLVEDSQNKDILSILAGILHFAFLFCVMHATIATFSFEERKIKDSHTKMKCWAALTAHMTGFAAIDVGCKMQKFELGSGIPIMSFHAVIIEVIILSLLFRFSDRMRQRVDKIGKGKWSTGALLWDEEAEEAENDIGALAVSFLTVQTLCFCISGIISDESALSLGDKQNPHIYVLCLCAGGLSFAALGVVLAKILLARNVLELSGELQHVNSTKMDTGKQFLERWMFIGLLACGMSFSWCALYVARWFVEMKFAQADLVLHENSTIKALSLALLISLISFACIFVLNWIHDADQLGRLGERLLNVAISSLGILIGFSWEQCFDGSVEIIAEQSEGGSWSPVLVKLFLAIGVVSVVVPAWRMYIMTKVIAFQEEEEEEQEKNESKNRDITPLK